MAKTKKYNPGDDPSIRNLRSAFGRQVKSEAASHPAYGFGTSGRDESQKLYLSKEQAKTMSGSYSQGAVYKSYGALGKQVDSAYPSAPTLSFGTSARSIKYGNDKQPGPGAYNQEGGLGRMVDSKRPTSPRSVFGTSTRDDAAKVHLDDELMKTYYGRGTPGPVYRVEGGVGRQTLSTRKTQPTVSFSTSTRLTYDNRDVPGAGAYNQGVALGRQVVSSRKTLPTAKIGSSTRDGAMKVFISKEHEKGTYGTGTPGPITANPYTAMGRQLLSRRPTSPGWGFGTSRRQYYGSDDTPGPGSYYA